MDEDIIRRRREEWLRTKGGGAKNGPNECHEEWKRQEHAREKRSGAPSVGHGSETQSGLKVVKAPPPSAAPLPSAAPPAAAANEKKRVRSDSDTENAGQNAKRVKGEFELKSFGQILDDEFSLVSWNLDGLMEKALCERTMYFIDMMKKRKPAVIMLQEVTDFSMKFIQKFLSKPYHILCPPKSAEASGELHAYYNSLLLSKYHWELDGAADCIFFPGSKMGRHLIIQRALAKNLTDGTDGFVFGTTHLESLKDPQCSLQRIEQTAQIFSMMENWVRSFSRGKKACIIVAGDFNARQTEINKAKKGFGEIKDVWEAIGSPAKDQYTWDMIVNDNLLAADGGGPPMRVRTRFDRMYLRKNEESSCNVTEFKIIGKQRIGMESNMFVSDHWGIAASVKLSAT